MRKMALALLTAGFSWGALSACGENHDVLGSRVDGGGPGAGTAGSGGAATGGQGAAGGEGGAAGGATGASGGSAGAGAGGSGSGGTGDGQAGAGSGGDAGNAAGAGESAGGASGSGAAAGSGNAGGAGGSGGEAGATSAGAAGTGGSAPACPTDCTRGTTTGCTSGQVLWTCGNNHDYQELIDGGCTDQATGLPRYCCPPEFYADCGACSQVTTLEACEARLDCHPVFTDPGPDGCACTAVGCCARFSRCADVGLANCVGPAACASPTPYCEEPAYVVSYADSCFEGCVRPEDCAVQ
jgi:hypothetical protein